MGIFSRGALHSLVVRLLWEQNVGGSNPLAPTIEYKQTTRKWGTKWGTYQLNFVDNSEAKS